MTKMRVTLLIQVIGKLVISNKKKTVSYCIVIQASTHSVP